MDNRFIIMLFSIAAILMTPHQLLSIAYNHVTTFPNAITGLILTVFQDLNISVVDLIASQSQQCQRNDCVMTISKSTSLVANFTVRILSVLLA